MAADLRVLKLALLAETKDFIDGLDKATKETKTFNQKLGKALKVATGAFLALGAAAGTAAIKIGKDAVAAAIEDQQSQTQLAKALKNSTGATDAQIKSTEKYITKIQNASGVTDTQLRQSLGNLVRSTQDATKAQELNNLAVDISIATGKDLNTVSEALAKAYQGQTGALIRLDPSIAGVIKQGADANEVFDALTKTFGGAAAENADTFAGKIEILRRRVEDATEAIGYSLLPIFEDIADFAEAKVVPAIEGLVRALTGGPRAVAGQTKEVNSAFAELGIVFNENDQAGYNLGLALKNLGGQFAELFGTVDEGTGPEGSFARFVEGTADLVDSISTLIGFIDRAIEKYRELKRAAESVGTVGEGRAADPLSRLVATGVGLLTQPKKTEINVNVRGGGTDPQGVAREVVKIVNSANTTTGLAFAQRRALK